MANVLEFQLQHRPWDNPNGYETTVNSLAQMCLEKQKRKKMENAYLKRKLFKDFPGGPVVKNPPSSAGNLFDPGVESHLPHWQTDFSPLHHLGSHDKAQIVKSEVLIVP